MQKDWLDRAEGKFPCLGTPHTCHPQPCQPERCGRPEGQCPCYDSVDRRTLGERRLDLVNPRTGETVRETIMRVERRQGGDRRAKA